MLTHNEIGAMLFLLCGLMYVLGYLHGTEWMANQWKKQIEGYE
jgi:hypothetical protein